MARILHIEDDPKSRLLVRKLLEATGHVVVDAESGLEGVRLADRERPDLVLIDINTPDLDGYEVILRLRGTPALAGVPLVAVTAEGDRQTSLAVGADGFIGKPIDASRFAKVVQRYLRGHRESLEGGGEQRLRERSHRIVERLERKVTELSEANVKLLELARLRREFLQNVSHELATPMTPIVGYVRLLLAEELGPLTPLQRKCLASVQASTQRLRSVVDTLLDVSALESGRMHFYSSDYDFAEEARRAREEAAGAVADAGLTLRVEEGSPACDARGDGDKVRRAMIHLLENAAKFTPRGGEVAVAVRRAGRGASLCYELLVADSGPGIAPEGMLRIFEPFYQVDGSATREVGGAGLGLAFARRVAQAMGGDVTVQCPPAEEVAGRRLGGSLFRLRVLAEPRGAPHGAGSSP